MRAILTLAGVAGLIAASGGAASARDTRGFGIGATAYGYVVPNAPNFVMVVAPLDVHRFHLEGRYNYEALHTGSVFAGLNAAVGEKLKLDATGMVGAVFGDVDGVAPGFRVSLSWWRLDAFSEGEYLINVHDLGDSFFYSWSELGVSPLSWLRLGGVAQRTKIVHTALDVQRGLLVGLNVGAVTATFYELDLGWVAPTYVFALGVRF
jgi:hypothetical protein